MPIRYIFKATLQLQLKKLRTNFEKKKNQMTYVDHLLNKLRQKEAKTKALDNIKSPETKDELSNILDELETWKDTPHFKLIRKPLFFLSIGMPEFRWTEFEESQLRHLISQIQQFNSYEYALIRTLFFREVSSAA